MDISHLFHQGEKGTPNASPDTVSMVNSTTVTVTSTLVETDTLEFVESLDEEAVEDL